MQETTLSELRNGKSIADIMPVQRDVPSWKRRRARPLLVDGVEICRLILEDRTALETQPQEAWMSFISGRPSLATLMFLSLPTFDNEKQQRPWESL